MIVRTCVHCAHKTVDETHCHNCGTLFEMTHTDHPMKFNPGDKVCKVGGSYQATGTIKAAFLADDGSARYVFRFDTPAGMLHIFSEHQLVESSTHAGSVQIYPEGALEKVK